LIDRLAARLGPRRIIRYVPQDTHVPEYVALEVPAQRKPQTALSWSDRPAQEPPIVRYGCSQCPRRSRLASR